MLVADLVGLAAATPAQAALHAALGTGGTAVAACGGALFAGLAAFHQGEGWRVAGFSALAAIALASTFPLAERLGLAALPSHSALLYMATALYVFLGRRRLFPELTANVLDAAVSDQRDAVLVFDRGGAFVDASTPTLAGAVSFEGMTGIADFLARTRHSLVDGRFFTLEELASMDARGMAREISVAGPERTRHFLALANPVRPGPRSRVGCVCGFYDITEQKHLEQELLARTAELTDLNAHLAGSLTSIERLQSARARRAAAEEVHRTIGGRIEELVASIDGGAAPEDLVAGCRAVLADVRATVAALFPGSARTGTRP